MDAETHHDQSKSIEEHGHEDGFSIDWLSEDLLAEELIQTDDASAYPANSHDTKDSLPSWLEPRAALATNRPTTYQTDRHQATDQLQLWQVLTTGVQKATMIKARKFQLVAKMTQQRVPDPAAWSPETSGQHPPSSPPSLAEKQPSLRLNQSTSSHEALASPSKRQKSSSSSSLEDFVRKDEVFDNTVENVRKKLKGNDLQSIMAVLIEVWNREIREMAEGVPAVQPPLAMCLPV